MVWSRKRALTTHRRAEPQGHTSQTGSRDVPTPDGAAYLGNQTSHTAGRSASMRLRCAGTRNRQAQLLDGPGGERRTGSSRSRGCYTLGPTPSGSMRGTYSAWITAERYRSGQTGQTVNLLVLPSEVRILPSPPRPRQLRHRSPSTQDTTNEFSGGISRRQGAIRCDRAVTANTRAKRHTAEGTSTRGNSSAG